MTNIKFNEEKLNENGSMEALNPENTGVSGFKLNIHK